VKPGFSNENCDSIVVEKWLHAGKAFFGGALFLVNLMVPFSCRTDEKEYVSAIQDRAHVPGMKTDSVTTLISDSGRIRYKLTTKVCEVYDKSTDPYWFFPKKIHFERFDDSLRIESKLQSDTARNFYRRKVWELKKNVRIINMAGETFETSLMYWDQRMGRIYSDSFIRIEKKEVILSGTGFESNQLLTKYTIFKPNGPVYIDSAEPDSLKMDSNTSK